MNLRAVLTAIAVAVLIGLGWWLQNQIRPPEPIQTKTRPSTSDYYMNDFVVTAMDKAGRPHYRLSANFMIHYPSDDHSDLTQPHLTVFNQEGPPYRVQAPAGKVLQGGAQVDLLGEVHIDRSASAASRPLHVKTYDLRVKPGEDYAETDKSVQIESDNAELQGVGMRAYLKRGVLELLSQARGMYEPQLR